MTNKQFIATVGAAILLLLFFLGLEKYRDCQQFGGHYCKVGRR
ncbi:MAG TPA: hypothetical protein VJL90_06320 [Pseudorhodoplanes sp.]|nr:hypothetical protein [Pseudorhodoplanes sp.]